MNEIQNKEQQSAQSHHVNAKKSKKGDITAHMIQIMSTFDGKKHERDGMNNNTQNVRFIFVSCISHVISANFFPLSFQNNRQ